MKRKPDFDLVKNAIFWAWYRYEEIMLEHPPRLPIYNEAIYGQINLKSDIFWVLFGLFMAYDGPWEACGVV